MNKKAQLNTLWSNTMIVVIFLIALGIIVIGFAIWGLVGPVTVQQSQSLGGLIVSSADDTGNPDVSNAANIAINPAIEALGVFEWMGTFILIVLLLGFMVIAFYVRTAPFLVFIWIGGMFILVVASIFISTSYIEMASGSLGNFYLQWGANDFIMRNLAQLMSVAGVMGAIILFTLVAKGGEGGVVEV